MKFGFTSIYSWRPHVEQMYYLSRLAEQGGHEVRFLTCDSDLPTCYTRQMRKHRPSLVECTACRLGGIRTFTSENIDALHDYAGLGQPVLPNASAGIWSSASTLGRFESPADFESPEYFETAERFRPATEKAYDAAKAWIKGQRLDAVFMFNGRLDVLRAVAEAAKDCRIPYVSMERTWLGHGLQLLPNENCLGLKTIDKMIAEWSDKPLLHDQAMIAAHHIAARFNRSNSNEWRAYNVNAQTNPWPVLGGKHRILLLPSSRSEIWGQADWNSEWSEPTAAYDALIEHLKLSPQDMVMRCHPVWAQNIGPTNGKRSEAYYSDWAKRHGVTCIPSKDPTSTLGLIEASDVVVVYGGTAAMDAGALGKQVISLCPSWYQKAGFQSTLYSLADLAELKLHKDMQPTARERLQNHIRQQVLRYVYAMNYRVMQFTQHVRCIKPTEYQYFDGADPARLTRMVVPGEIEADDKRYASDTSEEAQAIRALEAKDWESLSSPPPQHLHKKLPIQRRAIYGMVDYTRAKLRRGDL
ncbi:MAG TPA: hypothetical protein VFR09_03225 [Alphaproteobacteria bacterium]|nr:hypothetical protein [Alphaproteobacteria bacterium]